MLFETLLVDIDAEGVAVVTINRPEKLNALNAQVVDDLDAWFSMAADDAAVKGVLLTGAGEKAFVAGADIRQFKSLDKASGRVFADRGQAVFNRIEQFSKPVIAVVNGFALGGGSELAWACHMRVASTKAKFGQPEVSLGLIPGYGGTQRLPRLIGKGLATELVLTGDMVGADRAYEMGLVNRVFEPDALMEGARALLASILSKAPVAVSLSLKALASSDVPLGDGLSREAELFGAACGTDDFQEGVDAFLERRKATFRGR